MKSKMRTWNVAMGSLSLLFLCVSPALAIATNPSQENPYTEQNDDSVTQQRTRKVTGVVLDANGESIIGANVVEKGTTNGSITDIDGKFSFSISKPVVTLSVSYIGYQPQDYAYKGQGSVIITLKEDLQNLDEVVVVGYGVAKKRDLTGSVASVKGEKLKETASLSAVQAMQGRAAGVTIIQTSAKPGEEASIRVRGNRSLKATNEPLYVVDGIPIVVGLNELSPSDIESVEVLKDASATAIYGSRGANGVILVTTKKGKEGRVQIDYNGYMGVQQAARKIEMFDGAEWVDLVREANRATSKTTPYPLVPTLDWDRKIGYFNADPNVIGKIEQAYDEAGNWCPERLPYNSWTDEVLRAAPIHNHEVSVRGGTEKLKMLASATYFGQDGIVKGQDYRRYSVRVNFDWTLNRFVKVGGSTSFSHVDRNNGSNLYSDVKNVYPLADIYDTDGRLITSRPGNDPQLWNQFLNLDNMKKEIKKDRFLGSYYLDVTLPFDIKYRSNVGIDIGPWYGNEFYGALSSDRSGSPARAVNARDNRRMYTWENLLFYNKTFKKDHTLGLTFLQSIQQETYEKSEIKVKDLPYENQTWNNVGSAQTIESVSSDYQRWNLASFMGRVNYNYKDRYLLTVSARYDGSSRFPHTDQWAFFPSASIGYRFSEEAYFAPLKHIVSNGKLRASFGEIGNEAVGDYMFEQLISQRLNNKSTGYIYWIENNNANANLLTMYNMPDLVSSTLTWERIRTLNIGLDLGLLNDELTIGFDWFQRENRDMLAPAQVLPNTLGASAPYENAGTLRTRGWELNLNWRHTFGDFDVYANFNIGDSKTKVTKWDNDSKLLSTYYTGKTYGDIFGFETDRYFEEKDFTSQNADGSWNYANGIASQAGLESGNFHYGPGDVKFKDLDGNGKIDGGKGTADDHGDLKVIGNSMPRYEYSFHLGGAWKGIDLDLYFQGVGKREDWTTSSLNLPAMVHADVAIYSHQTSYNKVLWNSDYTAITGYEVNQGNRYPRLYRGTNNSGGTVSGIANGCNNYYPQSRYLTDMSYLRLKNVTVGYTLPKEWTRKAYIEKARIYFSGSNLFLLHKGNDLPVDPEISTGNGLTAGGWGRIAPITRTFSFGVQVTL